MPFAVAATGNGRWSFVSTGVGRSIDVLRAVPGGRTVRVTNSASHQLEAVNVSQLG